MPEYLIDEFIGQSDEQYTFEDQVDKKVSLLYDLCVLHKRGRYADSREQAVKQLLATCESEMRMDNAMHDIIVGKLTLDQMLKERGVL